MTKQHACELKALPLNALLDNPLQPARRTDDIQMKGIRESLKKDGLVLPLAVAPAPGRPGFYMLADGTRRKTAFEGETINCLVYETDPLDLFVLLNGTRKNIAANAWMSSYAGAEDESSRERLLQMMPPEPRRWIRALVAMLGADEVIRLGKEGKQSPGIVTAVRTANRLLDRIDGHMDEGTICRWMLKHNMQDMVNRAHKEHAELADIRRLQKSIETDEKFIPERLLRQARETLDIAKRVERAS